MQYRPDAGRCRGFAFDPSPPVMLAAAIVLFAAVGCGEEKDPTAEIRQLLQTCESAANAGDSAAVVAAIAEDYKDGDGRAKSVVAKRIRARMKQHGKRFVHARPRSVKVDADHATASVLVAMAGQRLGPKDDLLKASADLLKFELKLQRRDGKWAITAARWTRPSPLDVL